jgi:hypothetical protein
MDQLKRIFSSLTPDYGNITSFLNVVINKLKIMAKDKAIPVTGCGGP